MTDEQYNQVNGKMKGFYDAKTNKVYIFEGGGSVVAVHELLHFLSANYNSLNGNRIGERGGFAKHGVDFNEGVTQFLAELICGEEAKGVYEDQKAYVSIFSDALNEQYPGQNKLLDAYLKGDASEIINLVKERTGMENITMEQINNYIGQASNNDKGAWRFIIGFEYELDPNSEKVEAIYERNKSFFE